MTFLHVKVFKLRWRRLSRHVWSAALWPPFRCNGSHMKGEARVMLGEEQWLGLSNENKSRHTLNGALPPVSLLCWCPVYKASCAGLPHVTQTQLLPSGWCEMAPSKLFSLFCFVLCNWYILKIFIYFYFSIHSSKQNMKVVLNIDLNLAVLA